MLCLGQFGRNAYLPFLALPGDLLQAGLCLLGGSQVQGRRALELLEVLPAKDKLFFQAGTACAACSASRAAVSALSLSAINSASGRPSAGPKAWTRSAIRSAPARMVSCNCASFFFGVLDCLFGDLKPVFDRLQSVVGNHFFRAMGRRGVFCLAPQGTRLPLSERQGEARSLAWTRTLPGSFRFPLRLEGASAAFSTASCRARAA